MKNKITWLWNLIHYYIYVWMKVLYLSFSYINPVWGIFQITGIDLSTKNGSSRLSYYIDKSVFDIKVGTNVNKAGVYMFLLFVLIEYELFNLIQKVLRVDLSTIFQSNSAYTTGFILFVFFIVSGVFNYFTLFQSGKYLKYFKKFASMSKNEHRKFGWLCFGLVTFIGVLFISSLVVKIKK